MLRTLRLPTLCGIANSRSRLRRRGGAILVAFHMRRRHQTWHHVLFCGRAAWMDGGMRPGSGKTDASAAEAIAFTEIHIRFVRAAPAETPTGYSSKSRRGRLFCVQRPPVNRTKFRPKCCAISMTRFFQEVPAMPGCSGRRRGDRRGNDPICRRGTPARRIADGVRRLLGRNPIRCSRIPLPLWRAAQAEPAPRPQEPPALRQRG